jgi:hypothetical protein
MIERRQRALPPSHHMMAHNGARAENEQRADPQEHRPSM